MEETAGDVERPRVRRYGDLTAVMPDCEHNLCDMARTLRTGENAFRRPCNFKELRVVKRAHIATCALCACWQPLYRIGRTNIFHVTASNGIVSNSPYTPLAIMTASPIASVRSAMQMSSRYVRCAPNAVDDRTDHHADRSGPHRQVRRCHRSIYCWHSHAARRSALPRERFRRCHRSIYCWHSHAARRSALPRERFRPYVPFHVKATRPRCDDEGCPDRSGRASHKEGESWSIIAKRSWRWTLRNCVMRWRLPMPVETVRFGISASSTILKPRHVSSWQNSRANMLD